MWYDLKKAPVLEYNQPILSIGKNDRTELLVPQLGDNKGEDFGYKITGYNWLNVETGAYGSCAYFSTIEEALAARDGTKFVNASITSENV